MSSSKDFQDIQQQLKKTIVAHQNPVLQKELHELTTSIKKLSEEQRTKIQSLKQQIVLKEKPSKEQNLENEVLNNGLSNNTNSNNSVKSECQLKPITNRPALIIPQLSHKGVSLSAQSIRRPALAIKSITGQTQFLVPVPHSSNKNKLVVVPKQKVLNFNQYLKPVVKMPTLTAAQPLRSSHANTTAATPPPQMHTRASADAQSLLIRSANVKSPKVPLNRSLSGARSAPKMLTDKQSKDLFMMSLGLVTKESLAELQSRKCERKRRTTANPQFSSAALEAKRITKLEIAERKAKRRLLNNGDTGSSHTGSATNPHITPPAAGPHMPALNKTNTQTVNNNATNPKSIGVEQQEISPGMCCLSSHLWTTCLSPIVAELSYCDNDCLYIVTTIGKQLSANCFVCEELCECDCDSILFCKPCKTLFHAMCTTTKTDITQNNALPKCPKCETQRKKNEEKLAQKREERDNLVVKKKEFEDQLLQMKRALQTLKLKIREKSEEKVNLVASHEIVQQKVDKIIETLKLVEDTSEWEDGFAAGLQATAPNGSTVAQTLHKTLTSKPSIQMLSSVSVSVDEVVDDEEELDDEEADQDMEAMDDESRKAVQQLERLNKASEEDELNDEEEEEQELMDTDEANKRYALELRCDEEVRLESSPLTVKGDEEEQTPTTPTGAETSGIDIVEESDDRHIQEETKEELYELEECHETRPEMYEIYVEEVHDHNVGDMEAMDSENVGFFDTEVVDPTSDSQHMKGHEFSSQEEHQVMLY
ncbi:unnamed protein product [Oppiella nova]|uniref:PHD-type domain-containing protein n=1 Tax=Oppiella nova TaxID=334625 RepID=A0A7R9QFV2_9ACAR|nr:unnamed protein product [Oppiella nova]CAG2165070.1 unnamed protein product [Oppiella nova]